MGSAFLFLQADFRKSRVGHTLVESHLNIFFIFFLQWSFDFLILSGVKLMYIVNCSDEKNQRNRMDFFFTQTILKNVFVDFVK